MRKSVGIEAMSLHVPRRFLDLEDLARARGVDPEKYTVGLGVKEMAVADPSEDTVALAATALAGLIERCDLDPQRIGMLAVGTETGVDHAKPVASYVQGLLGLPRTMRTFDAKHACYGGTAALMACADWVASGSSGGKVGIAIAADIARYGIGTPGEPTQGAGAVAMLVSDTPRLLALDYPAMNGLFSADVHDFWRPHGRREALVDGHYSIECYLDTLSGAYRAWRKQAMIADLIVIRKEDQLPSESLARIIYHVPFCKMAYKAHARLRQTDLEDRQLDADRATAGGSFETQVAASLVLSSRIGNSYTASLYIGLLGLLLKEGPSMVGRRIGMFSYGSGCCGEFFSGVVGPACRDLGLAREVNRLLDQRERIGVEEYERLINAPAGSTHFGDGGKSYRFRGVEDDRRVYDAA